MSCSGSSRCGPEVKRSTYDLGVVHKTLGHDLGCSEFTPPDENVDVGPVLREVYQEADVRYMRKIVAFVVTYM